MDDRKLGRLDLEKREVERRALVVTATRVQYVAVKPVVEELRKRNWQVTVLRLEEIWERVEGFLMRKRRRTLKSFYLAAPKKPEKVRNTYLIILVSKLIYNIMRLLQLSKPNIVIVMSEGIMPPKVAVAVAKLADIPTLLLMQLGMLGRNYECPHLLADKISVAGDFIRELIIKCGISENRVVVTGRPAYDAFIQAEQNYDKVEICKRLGLDPTKRILVYCTENLPQRETRDTVLTICNGIRRFSDLQVIIKVHPAELSVSIYEEVAKMVGIKALVTRDAKISEILFICDVMITGFSTTALDAMILDKPVITMNFTGLPDPIPFAESGAAVGVYERGEIERAIEEGLYDETVKAKLRENRDQFVYEQAFRKDGKATDRVVSLIEQMVQENRKCE